MLHLTHEKLKHHQVAYITTNLEEALQRFDATYGIDRFLVMNTAEHPAEPPQRPIKMALVRTAGTEFEIIQPLEAEDHVYSDPLPKDGSFALQFHHIAVTFHGTLDEFEEFRAKVDRKLHPIVVDGRIEGQVRWFYTDERPTLGHYIEYCWFSPELAAFMRESVPVLASR
jgi:hypothetical protein